MKYIKKFENLENLENLELGTYIIFTKSSITIKDAIVNYLILGKIISFVKNKNQSERIGYVAIYEDFIANGPTKIGKGGRSSLGFNTIIYTSTSLKDTKDKFEELKETQPYYDWLLKQNMNKYNL